MRIERLEHTHLVETREVLAVACPFDRADVVAAEKLFGVAPVGPRQASSGSSSSGSSSSGSSSSGSVLTETVAPFAFGAWIGDLLVGVAAVCANRVRVLAVIPWARKQGVGSALLSACENAARDAGAAVLRTLDQPGNYLAPGIDVRNAPTIAWLEKRGYARHGDERTNVLISVRDNPRVSEESATELADACRAKGYEIRRARSDETTLLHAVDAEFGGAWSFELARALAARTTPSSPGLTLVARELSSSSSMLSSPFSGTPAVHVALRDGAHCGFAAHDGNNRGLGWFGPTGTWPAHRGRGIGEALLLACLVDVAEEHEHCEVAWIGPRPFYERAAGIADERRFVVLAKAL